MDEIEQVAFDMISNTGEARSLLMQIIDDAEHGEFANYDTNFKKANECLKTAQNVHLKIISSEADQKKLPFSILLVHAEDQMMAAELIRDLTPNIVNTNKQLVELKEKQK
ncbi:PTS lactose/cellobiose transporter subunit IIA [Lactobacillus sp. ESL0684]|uniref:PTS lactose/cellobiose transporter subunit IIA n=1 Tax=unclassified Lactobacillus TaxID=2620435 RepID=UPI0023F70EEB|nr:MULTISPECIES: PTS lactose/cellobiose transporter subunit IIA [unclassified Lactobacillus]WEV40210.1 PTS lactose/cellobiose transporter subunit IIA [Lactobacillus sp. ESL0681]WEV43265.1 PTS lactose/cellobiose transporter subunit IIA [Lactobacillus sp. ESL0684]